MAATAAFTLNATISAPREVVFDVLTDHRGYAEITPVRRAELEREGTPAPNGLGAIRALRLVGPPIREEVVEYEAPGRFAYKVISGLPVRDYLGTVTLAEAGEGTRVDYQLEVTPSVPLPAAVTAALMRPGIGALLRGIAKESERRAATGSSARS